MGERQQSLFDDEEPPREKSVVEKIDLCDRSVHELDRPRLKGQCLAIYNRLLQGPATVADLVAIAPKYTSRISDLRIKAGLVIENIQEPGKGNTTYVLKGKK